jgi:asparagine N-glycosylation enzyme membrane subunit Stt3
VRKNHLYRRLARRLHSSQVEKGGAIMLWTLAVALLLLWGLGLVTSYTLGGFIHILLVLAVVAVLIRVIQGRRIT